MKPALLILISVSLGLAPQVCADGSFNATSLDETLATHFAELVVDTRRQGGFIGHPREYSVPVSAEEKEAIHYIVTSLANRSLIWLLNNRSSLDSAGDRIDHVHPLRFLMCIFTDEELKVGIRNIRNNGWVWGDFMSGLKGSLCTEANIGNLLPDQLEHFAKSVNIDMGIISSAFVNQRWEEFLNLLITHIPRQGNHSRYDC